MPKLGVNIDHVATLRQARGVAFPSPIKAALICEKSGADSIVCHLREDRRHMQDSDVHVLRKIIRTKFNLEMSTIEEIVRVAIRVKPDEATLVPERRKELTTEGGLDVVKYKRRISNVVERLLKNGIFVSLFINADKRQIEAAKDVGAQFIEIHTGIYADACLPVASLGFAERRAPRGESARQVKNAQKRKSELKRIIEATQYARCLGLKVNAGHGLDYDNVKDIARIDGIEELNIGFSIIAKAVFVGLDKAVREMKDRVRPR